MVWMIVETWGLWKWFSRRIVAVDDEDESEDEDGDNQQHHHEDRKRRGLYIPIPSSSPPKPKKENTPPIQHKDTHSTRQHNHHKQLPPVLRDTNHTGPGHV